MNKNIEKFDTERPEVYEPSFDHEAEKEKRKQIRKMLMRMLTESLKPAGFKKQGHSLWARKQGDQQHIVYLQRSQFSHTYYIEAGICKEQDLEKGEEPDIVSCSKRDRIENIVRDTHQDSSEEIDKQKEKTLIRDIQDTLHFEIPDADAKYPGEYFVPSVSLEKAQDKTDDIKEIIEKHIPAWFDKYGKGE